MYIIKTLFFFFCLLLICLFITGSLGLTPKRVEESYFFFPTMHLILCFQRNRKTTCSLKMANFLTLVLKKISKKLKFISKKKKIEV